MYPISDKAAKAHGETPFVTHQQYRQKSQEIKETFEKELAEAYLPNASEEARQLVFDLAWDERHGAGFHTVESMYEDIARIVELALGSARVNLRRDHAEDPE